MGNMRLMPCNIVQLPPYVTSALTCVGMLQATGNLAEAEAYCLQLLDYGAPSKEKAKSLLREVRSLQRHQHQAAPAAETARTSAAFSTPIPMPLHTLAQQDEDPDSPGSDLDISPH